MDRFLQHIAKLREVAGKLEAQCCTQGDYEQLEGRISDLSEEADELESMIIPNIQPIDTPDLVRIGTKGVEVHTDYPSWCRPAVTRELIIFDETKAYWKARLNEKNPTFVIWFRKRDLVSVPKGAFPTVFVPNPNQQGNE